MTYQVWQVPTEVGIRLFPEKKVVDEDFTLESTAKFEAYWYDQQETAPDKHEFRHIIVKKV